MYFCFFIKISLTKKVYVMKIRGLIMLFILCWSVPLTYAQDTTSVTAASEEISENLDLEAVASVFGESKDLEEFEKKLNDPKTQISNLDLNDDGEVDYLRVLETTKGETHLIAVQAMVEKDQYQDVATIEVEKDSKGETQVQVVGDVYMYGPNYIIEPVYVHPPVVITIFWMPYYHPYRSPYYYGYYPPYYNPWRPYPPHRYQTNVHVHVNVNNSYRHTTVRKSNTSVELHNNTRKNDFGKSNPDKSYSSRNKGTSNQAKLDQNKTNANKSSNVDKNKQSTGSKENKSTGKKVQDDWKPQSDKKETGNVKSDTKTNKTNNANKSNKADNVNKSNKTNNKVNKTNKSTKTKSSSKKKR